MPTVSKGQQPSVEPNKMAAGILKLPVISQRLTGSIKTKEKPISEKKDASTFKLPAIHTDNSKAGNRNGSETASPAGSGQAVHSSNQRPLILSEHCVLRKGQKKVRDVLHKVLSSTSDTVNNDKERETQTKGAPNYSRLLNFYQLSVVERQVEQQIVRLKDLGDYYLKKAVEGSTLRWLTDATSLYNAALSRCEGGEHRRTLACSLREVEMAIVGQHERKKQRDIQAILPKRHPADSARRHKESIQRIRDFVGKQVLRIQMLWATMIPGEDKMLTRRQEGEVKKECLMLKKKIRLDLKSVVVDMVKECIETMGTPPCLFALVAMGDLAVEECTPFTDLELLLLIDEESTQIVHYFQRFAVYLQFKILNLGETPLSCSGVKVMDDIYFPALNAVFDPYSRNGIKLNTDQRITKIMEWCTISEMDDDNHSSIPIRKAQDILRPLTQLLLSDGGPIIFSLLQASVVYGDSELLQQVKHDIGVEYFRSPERRLQLCREIVESSLAVFELGTRFHFDTFELDLPAIQRELQVCHFLVQLLHVLYGLHASVPARIVEELHSRLLLSEAGEHDLKMLLCISHVLRCALHASARGQHTGKALLIPSKYNANKLGYQCHHDIFTFRRCSLISRLHSAALPLVAHFKSAFVDNMVPDLNGVDFMRNDLHSQLHTHSRCLQLDDAAGILRKIVEQLREKEPSASSSSALFQAYTQLGVLALRRDDVGSARRHFIHALDVRQTIADEYERSLRYIECWNHCGLVYLLEDNFQRAESYFKECVAMLDDLLAKQPNEPSSCQNDAYILQTSINESLGVLYARTGSIAKSVNHIQLAIDSLDRSEYQIEEWKQLLLRSAGLACLLQADFKAAHYYLKLALITCNSLACTQYALSVHSASLTFAIGQAAEGLGKLLQARVYKTSARHQFQAVLGSPSEITFETPKSIGIGQVLMVQGALNVYAECCMGVGEYAATLLLIEKGLLLSKIRFGVTGTRQAWHRALELVNKGVCLLKIKQVDSAMETLQAALETLQELFKKANRHNYFALECRRLVAVALMELGQFTDAKHELKLVVADVRNKLSDEDTRLLLARCMQDEANIYASQNEYDNALTVWQGIIEWRKQIYGPLHPLVAFAHADMGRLHKIMCDFDSAADNLILSVTMIQRLFGDNIPSVELAGICLDLAIAYQEAKRMALAETMLLKTTELWSELESLCSGHSENVRAHVVMGNFYRKAGKLTEALRWHRKALHTCMKATNIADKSVIEGVPELIVAVAVDYKLLGMHKECITFYEAAVTTHKILHHQVNDTLELSDWLNEMSNIYEMLGNKPKATDCKTTAANIRLAVLGEESSENEPESSLSLLAEQFEQRAQFQRAVPLREKALLQALSDHGSDIHQEVVQCYRHLIDTYLKIGLFERAQRRNDELLVLFRRKYGASVDHADVASTYRVAGYINHGLSKFDASKTQFKEALDMYYRLGVSRHRNEVVSCLTELAKCLLAIGEKQEAESNLEQANQLCASFRKQHQPCEPDVEGAMYMAMGWSCEAFPNFEQALAHYKTARRLFEKSFGPAAQNAQLALCLCALGRTQCVLGDYDSGIINLDRSVDMLQIVFGDGPLNRPEVHDAYTELARAHLVGGDPELSLEYYTKVLDMIRQKHGADRPTLQIAKHLGYVAHAAHKAGQYENAVKNATEAASMYNRVLKKHSTHPDTVDMLTLAGDVYMDMGQIEKALRQYKEAAHMVLLLHNGNALSKDVERAMIKVRRARLTLEASMKLLAPGD